jgi:hypothetical protein
MADPSGLPPGLGPKAYFSRLFILSPGETAESRRGWRAFSENAGHWPEQLIKGLNITR